MNCEAVQELLSAYSLGLLVGEEQAEVNAHLRTCRRHDEELVQLRATSFALDLLQDEAQASPALAERVATITATPRQAPRAARERQRRWWLPAAAVLALVAVFAAGWFANEALGPGGEVEVEYSNAVHGADGELVHFMGTEGGDTVTVYMAGLERLPAGQIYRLYAIRDGEWELIGQCNTDEEGAWLGDFDFALNAGEEVAVTVESRDAEPTPGDPILRTTF